MDDLISRQAAIDALNGIINRFEQILRDIRESKGDDSVCGMCEYDGAFVGQSGDWCNECPGFEKDDCFRLSDECRKRWLESVELPAAQPEKRTNKRTKTRACDLISRQAAISHVDDVPYIKDHPNVGLLWKAWIESLPSAQPDIIRCPDCYYNDGTAYCELHFRDVKAKDFCSWAERRE